jgi:hypothetical protein
MAKARDLTEFRGFRFWEQSATELFETANQLLGLLGQCSELQSLVETPLVGFACYMVALLGNLSFVASPDQ